MGPAVPEKLIPVVILKAVAGKPIPLYGDGLNMRGWLYVDDHVKHCCWRQHAAGLELATA